jgi:Family of unknown function (DUF5985)
MIGQVVFILCALTCAACAVLLLRAYRSSRARLLFWCGLSFVLFAVTNALLFVDFLLGPTTDLSLHRSLLTMGAIALMVYGLIFDS